MGKALVLHEVNLDPVPGIAYGPLSAVPGISPECHQVRPQNNQEKPQNPKKPWYQNCASYAVKPGAVQRAGGQVRLI